LSISYRRFCGNALFDLGFRKKGLDYFAKDPNFKQKALLPNLFNLRQKLFDFSPNIFVLSPKFLDCPQKGLDHIPKYLDPP
jgi:hypothetical protein